MKRIFNIIAIFFTLLLVITGCKSDLTGTEPEKPVDPVEKYRKVTFKIDAQQFAVTPNTTAPAVEGKIYDINILRFSGEKLNKTQRIYYSAKQGDNLNSITIDLIKDKYESKYEDVYIVANWGADMSKSSDDKYELTRSNFTLTTLYPFSHINPDFTHDSLIKRGLPMVASQNFYFKGDADTTVHMKLRHLFAKVEVNVAVDESATRDIVIDDVSVAETNTYLRLFKENRISSQLGNGQITPTPYTGERMIFYVPENRAGKMEGITSFEERVQVRDRTKTHIRIQTDGWRWTDFRIGENLTDDFNVIGGSHYNYDLSVTTIVNSGFLQLILKDFSVVAGK